MKILTTALALLLLAGPALAADNMPGGAAGKVTHAKGTVSLYQTGRSAPTPLGKGDPIFAGDEIETGKNAAVTVHFADDSALSVGQNGKIIVSQYKVEGKTAKTVRLNTGNGAFEWMGAQNGTRDTEITTDSGTIAVGGAHVIRAAKGAETTVYVQSGTATVKTSGGKVDVSAGHGTTIAAKGAKPGDAAPMSAEQIAWIRAELPAPVKPWDAQSAAAPAPEQAITEQAPPEQVAPVEPPAPMEVPPVSAAPAPAEAPVETPAAAPAEAPQPVAAPVEKPVTPPAAPAPAEQAVVAPAQEPLPVMPPVEEPGANPQAAVVTPAPAPLPALPPLSP